MFFYGTRFYKSVITIEDRALNYAEKERNVVLHENQNNNYSKYYPHQTRFDKDVNGKRFIVTINNKGFRGIDIETRKANNVLRIVCLGASSTFGYGNRDQETYPYYLQTILNADKNKIDLTRFNSIEVINLGIPHLDSEAIYYLFINEAIPLNPDIVTFYEGYNDAAIAQVGNTGITTIAKNNIRQTFRYLRIKKWLLTAKLMNELFRNKVSRYDWQYYLNYNKGRSEFLINNLSLINKTCKDNNIRFYVITQQSKSFLLPENKMKGISYEEEVRIVTNKIQKEPITISELRFLVSSILMESVRKWAKDNNIILIDGIRILNNDRDCLASHVHLTPKGNYKLAEEIARVIILTYKTPET